LSENNGDGGAERGGELLVMQLAAAFPRRAPHVVAYFALLILLHMLFGSPTQDDVPNPFARTGEYREAARGECKSLFETEGMWVQLSIDWRLTLPPQT
jgi:hypothetical protein